ncbi:MAG TPA: hypothetical protein DCL48_00445 [Alphaproteobacteria bacterium]|nr:hypothetical protein [Alphaproteobacteria bacterium]
MIENDLYTRLGVALAIGLGVGIERGFRQRSEKSGERVAGLRTFALLALLGAGIGIGLPQLGPVLAGAVALGVAGLLTAGYWRGLEHRDDHGLTTEIAALVTLVAGALAGAGLTLAAGLIGVAMMVLLHLKDPLHRFIQRIEALEISAALKLLVIAVVLLPVLPDQAYGPGGVLNPRTLLWAVIVVATLGFAAHVAMRVLGGHQGALALGVFGGLVSSTGVALSAARLSRAEPGKEAVLAAATGAAQAVMFVRVAAVLAALKPALFTVLAVPLLCGALTALGASAVFLSGKTSDGPWRASEPDQILSAIQFVALAALCLVLGQSAAQARGDTGFLLSAFISGLADVDAAVVLATQHKIINIGLGAAGLGVVLAIVANALAKTALALWLGAAGYVWRTAAILVASSAATGIAALALGLG